MHEDDKMKIIIGASFVQDRHPTYDLIVSLLISTIRLVEYYKNLTCEKCRFFC